MKRVLVTGGSGFIGSEIIRLLVDSSAVRTCSRSPAASAECEILAGDLRDQKFCSELVREQQILIHLAEEADTSGQASENVQVCRNLLNAALTEGLERFIYVSSAKAAYPDSSVYARNKRDCEQLLIEAHEQGLIKVVCMRPGIVFGRGMKGRFASLMRLSALTCFPGIPGNTQALSMVSVQDFSRLIGVLIQTDFADGKIWTVSDGIAYSLEQIVQTIRQRKQLRLPVLKFPQALVKVFCACMGILPGRAGRLAGPSLYKALYMEKADFNMAIWELLGLSPQDTLYSKLEEIEHTQ